MPVKFCGYALKFSHKIRALGVKIMKPRLKVRAAGFSNTIAVLERSQVLNVELHGDKQRILLAIRISDVTEAI